MAVFVHLWFQDMSQPLKEASCWQPILHCLLQSFVKYPVLVTGVCEATNAVDYWSALSWKFPSQIIWRQEVSFSVLNLLWPASCVYSLCARARAFAHAHAGNKALMRIPMTASVLNKLAWGSHHPHIHLVISKGGIMQFPHLMPIVN